MSRAAAFCAGVGGEQNAMVVDVFDVGFGSRYVVDDDGRWLLEEEVFQVVMLRA